MLGGGGICVYTGIAERDWGFWGCTCFVYVIALCVCRQAGVAVVFLSAPEGGGFMMGPLDKPAKEVRSRQRRAKPNDVRWIIASVLLCPLFDLIGYCKIRTLLIRRFSRPGVIFLYTGECCVLISLLRTSAILSCVSRVIACGGGGFPRL